MLAETLTTLFDRDLNKLKDEISSYRSEAAIWITQKEINNSAGNLILHLTGNLNTYIGLILGKVEFVRDREFEFSAKGISREVLSGKIAETRERVRSTLSSLPAEALDHEYPLRVFGEKMTTEYFLVHLLGHLNYHLGQINYHRRLLDTN